MDNSKPIFDPATRCRIEVRGRADAEWLQSFDSSAEISVCETRETEGVTVLDVRTDQAGMVGLVRTLHGLGIATLHIEIVQTEFQIRLQGEITYETFNSCPCVHLA